MVWSFGTHNALTNVQISYAGHLMQGGIAMNSNEVNKISIDGDLSMAAVTEKFPVLAEYLAGSAAAPDQQLYEIDLTGVEALDACGCQLLVAFIHNLKKSGAILSLQLSDSCRDIIHNLGFDDDLSVRGCA